MLPTARSIPRSTTRSRLCKLTNNSRFRFGQHSLDTGNQAIQAAVHCEKVISLLNHLRENHKDGSALIQLQKQLRVRRNALFILKRHNFLAYHALLRLYEIEDLESVRGEGIHHKNFHCKAPRYGPG